MESCLLCHLPDVICNIVMDYHLFVNIKQCQISTYLQHALPYNDHYFFGITLNSLVRCCTQTLKTTCLLSISNIMTFLRLDEDRLVLFAEDGIYIYHILARTHTYFKRKLSQISYDRAVSVGNIVYFCGVVRLFIFNTETHTITSRRYHFPIVSLRVYRQTLILRTAESWDFIGPSFLNELPPGLDQQRCLLIPHDNGIVVHRWDGGNCNYLFGQWVKGTQIRQFLRLPDGNHISLHHFHLTFYVAQKPVHTVELDNIMSNCFVIKDRLFCFASGKVLIVG